MYYLLSLVGREAHPICYIGTLGPEETSFQPLQDE